MSLDDNGSFRFLRVNHRILNIITKKKRFILKYQQHQCAYWVFDNFSENGQPLSLRLIFLQFIMLFPSNYCHIISQFLHEKYTT